MNQILERLKPKITKPYKISIKINIEGKAEAKEKELPFLPESYIQYLQSITNTYLRMYEKDGIFILTEFTIEIKDILTDRENT